jgi:uroporphyrin-III C-methyltransferase
VTENPPGADTPERPDDLPEPPADEPISEPVREPVPEPEPVREPLAEPRPAEAPAPARRSGGAGLFLLWLVVLAGFGAGGWWLWQQQQQAEEARDDVHGWQRAASDWERAADALATRTQALAAELEQVRERQRGIEQRLTDLTGGTRLMREEVLGISERAASLEDALARLARSRREGAQTLQLDEIEFLLQLAAERLELFGDTAAADRALTLAAASVDAINDPVYAGLRQTLGQELSRLRALPTDARPLLRAEIADLQRLLPALPPLGSELESASEVPSRLRGLLDSLVTIRRIDDAGTALTPLEQSARKSALVLQLSLAQVALEHADAAAWALALDNALSMFDRQFEARAQATVHARLRLQALREAQVAPPQMSLGAALQELRNLRATRRIGQSASEVPAPGAPSPLAPAPASQPELEPQLEVDDDIEQPAERELERQ